MALIAVSGQPGCRFEEVARIAAQRLEFQLVTVLQMNALVEREFGVGTAIPDKAYPDVVASLIAHLAAQHHVIFCAQGAELLFKHPEMLRVHIVAPEPVRSGNLMLDHQIERPSARRRLAEMEAQQKSQLKRRFGRAVTPSHLFDLILNAEQMSSDQMVEIIASTVRALGLCERGLLSETTVAHLQFPIRMRLAKHGIVPPGRASLTQRAFVHPSEQVFANLLDFYRIAWQYEPRSFPIQWDAGGKVSEAFTPDFYLPEFDMYVELTTMKQSHVTRKNRKIRLLRQIYPHINIQVFYQKDFENLVFKYGLERLPGA